MTKPVSYLSAEELLNVLAFSSGATAIYTTDEIIIQYVNDAMIAFWGVGRNIIGKPLEEAVPALKGQPFKGMLQQVLQTGITDAGKAIPATLMIDGKLQTSYYDYEYRAICDAQGKPYCILHTATDVTEEVRNKKQVDLAEDQLRLAVESAGLGTWLIDAETRAFTPSATLKQLLGFNPSEEMSYEMAIALIAGDEERGKVIKAVEEALINGKDYDLEYPVIRSADQQLIWVQANGKLYTSESGKPLYFFGTVQDITRRKLEDQQKEDFISIASHELKTPVTSLKASLQLLEQMKHQPSALLLPRLIDQCIKSMNKMTGLVDELLDTSRITQGQISLHKTRFKVAQMLNDCCSHVRMAGMHELVLQGDPELEVVADEHRVDQVVVNFVNNAVKYAPQSKEIYLKVERLENMAKISVKDKGPGIAPDQLAHLFSRYYRVKAGGRNESGLGLGLYISSEIIRKHGGQTGVESEIGKGSTFWFTLPLEDH